LQNIPSIIELDEVFEIVCDASENTTNWNFELLHDDNIVDLEIISSEFDTSFKVWRFKTKAISTDLYELYDLKVTASRENKHFLFCAYY
jgi:phage replication-related protein YjqB (UPF0714/DUF867 family)